MAKEKFKFVLLKKEKKVKARRGFIETPHGNIQTPAFSPVGTKASVKGLDIDDLKKVGAQVVLGNAYHLYLRPGLKVIESFGGFSEFMRWDGPSITDSGGYQVSFIWNRNKKGVIKPHITDMGIYFRSHIDGSKHFLSPKKSMEIQRVLGADIIMAFDQPMGYQNSKLENEIAFERSFKWEEESFTDWEKNKKVSIYGQEQALFGIVQGQTDTKKRIKSIKFILSMDYPGIAVGGETIGSDPKITAKTLDSIKDYLPDDKPVHALGLGGGPEGVIEAVERGVDIFDNTSVTRMARTGLLFIYPEDGGTKINKFRLNIRKSLYKNDKKPISKNCNCFTCQNYSKAYLHHMIVSNELLGMRMASIHNVCFYNNLMDQIRSSIENNDFLSFKKHWLNK